jgi:hypothetical protein
MIKKIAQNVAQSIFVSKLVNKIYCGKKLPKIGHSVVIKKTLPKANRPIAEQSPNRRTIAQSPNIRPIAANLVTLLFRMPQMKIYKT